MDIDKMVDDVSVSLWKGTLKLVRDLGYEREQLHLAATGLVERVGTKRHDAATARAVAKMKRVLDETA